MNNRIMKRLCTFLVCACAYLIYVPAVAAQTFPADGDTISIVFPYSSWSGTRDYYLAATSSTAVGYAESASMDGLWQVVYEEGSTTRFRLCNLNRGQWLRVATSGSTTFSLQANSTNSSVFSFGDITSAGNQTMRTTLQYISGATTYYVYFYMSGWYGNSWRTTTNASSASAMRIDRWTKRQSTSLTHTSVPQSMAFVWAQTTADAAAQAQTVTYSVTLVDSSYIYNIAGMAQGYVTDRLQQTVVETYKPDEILSRGYSLTWRWNRAKSAAEQDSSYLTDDMIANLDNEQYREVPRTVMYYSDVKKLNAVATSRANWSVLVTPENRSPLNLMSKATQTSAGQYIDYEDELILEIWKDGNVVANKVLDVTRHAFHYTNVDDLIANLEPSTHYFPAQESPTASLSQEFRYWLVHRQGLALLDAKGNVAEREGKPIYDKTRTDTLSRKDINANDRKFTFSDANNKDTVKWLSWSMSDDKPFTITAQPNTGSTARKALFVGSFYYKNHHVVIHSTMFQRGSNEEGDRKFIAYPGIANGELDANGRQPVHQLETTIYYEGGEEVELRPTESMFLGYMRWYDYETGKAPQYTKDGKETANFWAGRPRYKEGTTVYDMTAINDDPVYSHGLYAYAEADGGYINGNRTFIPPTINAWTDQQERRIACDLSCYRDYKITNDSVQEPTLSTRQIFHLIPGERMADRIDALGSGEAYEDYHYIAPISKEVFLETRFAHYTNGGYVDHMSELCYFFWGKSGTSGKKLRRLGVAQGTGLVNGVWYRKLPGETAFSAYTMKYNNDYASVSYDKEGTVVYELRIPASAMYSGKEVVLARFKVDYMDRATCGPSEMAGQTLISGEEIAKNYVTMAMQDFNFNSKPASTASEYLDQHLDWAASSYGYTYVPGKQYPDGTELLYIRNVNNPYSYYGEYCLVNRVGYDRYTNTWLQDTEQHGGAENGYCMYVDGAKRSGLVVSIATSKSICSGQQLFCSAWICNPSKETAGALPIFRFNVQGRNKNADGTYTDWEDVGIFFAGELAKQSGWRQVVFPLKSASNYDESRVSIYNFATTNAGNDFLIDDVCLFASKLPLAAYQLMTTCQSDDHEAAVARIDYTLMSADWGCKPIYYDIYDETAGQALNAEYYNVYGDQSLDRCGCIIIPEADYDPAKTADQTYREEHTCSRNAQEYSMVYSTVSDFVDAILQEYDDRNKESNEAIQEVTMKGYVPATENGTTRYVMYVGHIADKNLFNTKHTYKIRMAPTQSELSTPDCALTTELPIYDNTAIDIDGEQSPYRNACANTTYRVAVKVTNINSETQVTTRGTVIADWLMAYPFDSCYADRNTKPAEEQMAVADALYKNKYGYDRGDVEVAIRDFRRLPEQGSPNPNYTVSDVSQIRKDAFLASHNYDIIKNLCDRGLLTLYKEGADVFLDTQDTVAYWLFPIQGTSRADEATTVTLYDCDDPQMLLITPRAKDKSLLLNLSPLRRADMTDVQRAMVPNVRVAASKANTSFTVPVGDINGVSLGWDSCQVVASTDPLIAAKIGRTNFSMHYTQDRIWSLIKDNEKYYHAGDYIIFTPVSAAHVAELKALHDANPALYHDNQPGLQRANTDTMRAGYQYTMHVQLLDRENAQLYDEDRVCLVGYASFNVIVVPDTMVWVPTASNEWGDDRNWRAVIGGKQQSFGYAPLPETVVVIPQLDDAASTDLYPRITRTNLQPMDAHYTPSSCRKIHFNPQTRMLNQHMLSYDSAYVDMYLPQADWYSVSAPLQGMYSGDFFVPHSGNINAGTNLESSEDFTVSPFVGKRDHDAAYAFWVSLYNRSVSMLHSTNSSVLYTGTAAFRETNAMNEPVAPAAGFNVMGFGPDNINNADLVVRLPKPDTRYYYFYNGDVTGDYVTLNRSQSNRLAYPLTDDYTFTLTNTEADTVFLFGNPTMAYIDMKQFLNDNPALRDHFLYIDQSAWHTVSLLTMTDGQRYVAPMRSVKLTAKEASTSLTVTLLPEHLSLTPSATTPVMSAPQKASAAHIVQREVMDITAVTPNGCAYASLAKMDFAHNQYDADEDVPFVSSGVEAGVGDYAATTPVNIYTVAGTQSLLADIREGIGVVPVGFLIADGYRTDSMTLAFALSPNWDTECYLCDTETGNRIRIANDAHIRIATPANHELRYYIQGPDNKPDTPTDIQRPSLSGESVYTFSPAAQQVTVVAGGDIARITAYDIAGHVLRQIVFSDFPTRSTETCSEQTAVSTPVCTITLPSGIVLLDVRLHGGEMSRSKVVVK